MSSVRVLLADDHAGVRAYLRAKLGKVFEIVGAVEDGKQAVDAALRLDPDVLVLDISMPGIDGVAVCQEIKRDPAFRLTPVILISSSAGVEDHLRGITAGADDFFPKPLNLDRLAARVRALTERKAFTDELEAAERRLRR